MEKEVWNLDLKSLKELHDQKQQDFTAALLSGADWKDLQEERKQVTELSIALYRRMQSEENPAEHLTRKP